MKNFISLWERGTYYRGKLAFPGEEGTRIIWIDTETGFVSIQSELLYGERGHVFYSTPAYIGLIHVGNNKLLFVPRCKKEFVLYDLLNQKPEIIKVDSMNKLNTDQVAYWEYLVRQEQLFLFPYQAEHILCVDLTTFDIDIIDSFLMEIIASVKRRSNIFFSTKACRGDDVFLAMHEDNYILKLNMDNFKFKLYELKNEDGEYGFRDIVFSGDYLYAVNCRLHLLKYKSDDFSFLGRVPFLDACGTIEKIEDGAIFVPAYDENFIVVDNEGYLSNIVSQPMRSFLSAEKLKKSQCIFHTIEAPDAYYVVRNYTDRLIKIDKQEGTVINIPLKYDKSVMDYFLGKGKMFMENSTRKNKLCIDLEVFIDIFRNNQG